MSLLQEIRQERVETPVFTSGSRQDHERNTRIQTRAIRLEFPRFDGIDPASWVYRAAQFFSYHQTPPNQWVSIASFHLERKAL